MPTPEANMEQQGREVGVQRVQESVADFVERWMRPAMERLFEKIDREILGEKIES